MSFATHQSMPPTQRPALRTHSSVSSSSTSSTVSSISSASSPAHSSPQSRPIKPGSSKLPSAPHHHHHHHQPTRRTAGSTSPLLMLVHPHAPIHTPMPPSLQDRRTSVPNLSPFTAPLAGEDPWFDNAEFRTPAGTPASAPCSACSSPLFDPRPVLPLRKSADSANFPFHSQRH